LDPTVAGGGDMDNRESRESRESRELLEWLGITLADLFVYLATAAIVAMFFVFHSTASILLAILGVAFALLACPPGMKRDPEVSNFTNAAKLVAYPVCVLFAVAAVVVRFTWFNG
jgi:hypothetical protein